MVNLHKKAIFPNCFFSKSMNIFFSFTGLSWSVSVHSIIRSYLNGTHTHRDTLTFTSSFQWLRQSNRLCCLFVSLPKDFIYKSKTCYCSYHSPCAFQPFCFSYLSGANNQHITQHPGDRVWNIPTSSPSWEACSG